MSTTTSVVLVHRNDIERASLRQALEAIPSVQIAGERTDLRSGMALAHQVRPDILILDLVGSGDDTFTAASQYRLEDPDVALFLAGDAVQPDTLMRAMRAGAQEILKRPLDRAALAEAVERVAQLNARKHGGTTQRTVITVFSNKGGIGVSTIASNMAVGLRRMSGRDVALADLDYQSGDAASMMGIAAARSIGDLISIERLDSPALQGVLTRHASGVMVLPQPESIDQVDGITAHQVGEIIEVLGSMHPYVVVDAPHLVNDIALEIFDRSSQIFMVAELSVPSVRAAKRSLDIFHKLNYLATPDRVKLVINRRSEKAPISPVQVEDTLGMPISFNITNDYAAVSDSINLGKPLCENEPRSRAGKDIDVLTRSLLPAVDIVDAEVAPVRRKGIRLFGRG